MIEGIHQAAWDGDVVAIDWLVVEDGRRLNAQIQGDVRVGYRRHLTGCSPLMPAARRGHNAAVARLLALGADVELKDAMGYTAADIACGGRDLSSVLALLLDAGALVEPRHNYGSTPLIEAAYSGNTYCVALLIERGGVALDLDAKGNSGITALYWVAFGGYADNKSAPAGRRRPHHPEC